MVLCLLLQPKIFLIRALPIKLLDIVEKVTNTSTYLSLELETFLKLKIEKYPLVLSRHSAVITRKR